MACLQRKWRNMNRHNMTFIANPISQVFFPLEKVKVGNNSYGGLHVVPYNKSDGLLQVGNYCSIARDVKFLLGGNHDYKRFSTYPFKLLLKWPDSSFSKGDIIIGDDVWIGENVLFLSGVTVGQGAVIAANTVVSHDVMPYEIVGGNPMRHIKYRFSALVIENLLRIDFSLLSQDIIQEHEAMFVQHLDDDNIEDFMTCIPKYALRPISSK